MLVEHKKKLAYKSGEATNTELMSYMIEKEHLNKIKQDHIQSKYQLKAYWERNKENIGVFENKIELIKSKIMFIKGILKEYYCNLLHKGGDNRYFSYFIKIIVVVV